MESVKLFGYIILRDIPKEVVQLDLTLFDIQGGFRGFAEVLPGVHYVSVKVDGEMINGCWLNVEENGIMIKIFDYETNSFQDCFPEEEENYKQIATSGVMNKAFIPVALHDNEMAIHWKKLTSHLSPANIPFKLNFEEPMMPPVNLNPNEMGNWLENNFKSRFEQAFYDTHKGFIDSFLEEFEFSFVKYLVRQKDQTSLARWIHLLNSIFNAGERSIENEQELFYKLIDILILQFESFSIDTLSLDVHPLKGIDYLIEDMKDTEIKDLIEKAKELKDYLIGRGVKMNF